jgi:hypothetical protein
MKRLAAIVLLAAGCGSPSGTGPAPDEMKFEMGVASQIAFDVTKLKRGERTFYTVKVLGNPKPDYVTFAVVDDDADSIWIENTVPADPRSFVIKSRFKRKTGELMERWAGEPGSAMPAKLYPREGRKPDPVPLRDSGAAQPEVKEDVDTITVAGKTWTATRVTTTLAYPDGRKSVLTDWYHKDVPFSVVIKTGTPNEKSYGGLVKRQFGRLTMELLRWDTKATTDLVIPKEEKK